MTDAKELFDRELELEKIKTVKETFQSYFNIGSSILTGGLTALVVLTITLYFNNTFGFLTAIVDAVMIGVIMGVAFTVIDNRNKRFLKRYDEWIKRIENKIPLPSVIEMTKEI